MGFLFTPALYLEPFGVAVFRQTASDPNDFTSSSVYQNPGCKYEASTVAVSVEYEYILILFCREVFLGFPAFI